MRNLLAAAGQGSVPYLNKLKGSLKTTAENSYGSPTVTYPLPVLIGRIISQVLGLLGIIFLCLTVYAGYKWMLARGNEKDVETAKDTLRTAVIGMAITLASYAISNFVVSKLIDQTLA